MRICIVDALVVEQCLFQGQGPFFHATLEETKISNIALERKTLLTNIDKILLKLPNLGSPKAPLLQMQLSYL